MFEECKDCKYWIRHLDTDTGWCTNYLHLIGENKCRYQYLLRSKVVELSEAEDSCDGFKENKSE